VAGPSLTVPTTHERSARMGARSRLFGCALDDGEGVSPVAVLDPDARALGEAL
jgi:hypothetical protein